MRKVRTPILACLVLGGLVACAAPRESVRQERPPGGRDATSLIKVDSARVLGTGVLEEVEGAPFAVIVRGPTSFPRMIQGPDGAWSPEPPSMAAAIRGAAGWTRVTSAGRWALPAAAGRQLDRLLADPGLWSEVETPAGACTDPSGILVQVRSSGRTRTSAHPCGFAGVNGAAGSIVLAGDITDWRDVPSDERPAGVKLRRFDEATESLYRFYSGIVDERRLDIRSASEWEAQWARLTASSGPRRAAPPVDFAREMVLVATMGARPSGGYRVVIDRVLETPAGLEAYVRHVSPGPRCGVAAALSRPADVVAIPASPQPVHWLVETAVSDCP